MSTARPKLGDVFRGTPDRSSGLSGLLRSERTADEAATPAHGAESETVPPAAGGSAGLAEPPVADGRPAGRRQRTASPRNSTGTEIAAAADAAATTRVVSVVLNASLLTDFRAFAARMEQTLGVITLRAIEANADELAGRWQITAGCPPAGSLFSAPRAMHRREEPGVSTQLRLRPSDVQTLDRLVDQWGAPSRSALVNEALTGYVRTRADASTR